MSLRMMSLEKESEEGSVSVFLLRKSSFTTLYFICDFNIRPSDYWDSFILYKPQSTILVFSAIEHEYSKLSSYKLWEPSSTTPTCNFTNFYRVFVSMILKN